MSTSSFTGRILPARGLPLYLVRGCHGRTSYWAFLLVDKPKLPLFLKRLGGGIRLQDYGSIVAWGQGRHIAFSVRNMIEKQYGIPTSALEDSE